MSQPIPIMLIHGFNGAPAHWVESGFRQSLLTHGDLDPSLVRLFRYGVAPDGTYDNRGDLRPIAARLAGVGLTHAERLTSSIDQLSADSVASGGPSQVTIIAHSLGGVISRYYLSRRAPDAFGTLYRGAVSRLITIGTPHRGVDLLALTRLAPRYSPVWWFLRLLEKLGLASALPASAVAHWNQTLQEAQRIEREQLNPPPAENRVLLTDTPIYEQLHPDSALLAELGEAGMLPDAVTAYTCFGDIRLRVHLAVGRWTWIDQTTSFGDLVVPAESARSIPGAQATSLPFISETGIDLTLWARTPARAEARGLSEFLPDAAHAQLLANERVQAAICDIVLS